MDNPERKLGRIVHIAGTNGKGSVSAMLASMAKENGLKVGLYTSPHLISFTERIRINGLPIPEQKVADICSLLKNEIESIGATFFEVTTAMAYKHFADEDIDMAIIETGMGGRLDATNILASDFTVITNIGLEHTEWLGETTEKIAEEKAAIIRPKSQCVTGVKDLDALEVITKVARERKSKIHIVPAMVDIQVVYESLEEMSLHIRSLRRSYHGFKIPFFGKYQTDNIAIAIITAEQLGFSEADIRNGIIHLKKNTGFRARLEQLQTEPMIILDVSHNGFGMARTVQALLNYISGFDQVRIIFACVAGKDTELMLEHLKSIGSKFYLPKISTERAMPLEELQACCQKLQLSSEVFGSAEKALEKARSDSSQKDLILITGSFYLAGEILGTNNWPNVQVFDE